MKTRRFVIAAALAVAAAPLLTFGPLSTQAAAEQISLYGAGATFPAPLYKKWIEVYTGKHSEVAISYQAVGSGEGISQFVSRSIDFGASDVGISDADAAKVADGVVTVPGTAGMIVLAYNLPGLGGALKLPRDVYADIFAGTITRWDDPKLVSANPGLNLPHANIAIVARVDSSGTTAAFSGHLYAISKTWQERNIQPGKLVSWPGSAMLVRGNEGVSARINISEGSIGYVEYGFAHRLGLPVAALENQAGQFVQPSEEAGETALAEATAATPGGARLSVTDPVGDGSYPIVTYSWLLLYKQYANTAKAEAIRSFIGWGLTDGQEYSQSFGYIPLPENLAARGEEALASIK